MAEVGGHVQRGKQLRWVGVLLDALNHRAAAQLQLGDVVGAGDDTDRATLLAEQFGSTFFLARAQMGQALMATVRGNHEAARRLASAAVETSQRRPNLLLCQAAQEWWMLRAEGRAGELFKLEPLLDSIADPYPLFLAGFGLAYAEHGRLDDANRLLTRVLTEFPDPPHDWLWLATTTVTLQLAVAAGNAEVAQRFADVLTPYADQWALAGRELLCLGPVRDALTLVEPVAFP